jgi:signal transduction histidine kinase
MATRISIEPARSNARTGRVVLLRHPAVDVERRRNIYLATVAHEMRNALAPLANVVDVLARRAPDDPATLELVPIARRQLRQLAVMTGDLMDLGRALSDERLTLVAVSVQEAVAAVVAAWRPAAVSKGQAISLTMPASTLCVMADRVRLEQALQNIVSNAIKYTPDGGYIRVLVRRDADVATIIVSDSGIGLLPSHIANVFELFYRAPLDDASTEGVGIGLALARRLVERHGGTIEATSAGLGQGAVFTIELPLSTLQQ